MHRKANDCLYEKTDFQRIPYPVARFFSPSSSSSSPSPFSYLSVRIPLVLPKHFPLSHYYNSNYVCIVRPKFLAISTLYLIVFKKIENVREKKKQRKNETKKEKNVLLSATLDSVAERFRFLSPSSSSFFRFIVRIYIYTLFFLNKSKI